MELGGNIELKITIYQNDSYHTFCKRKHLIVVILMTGPSKYNLYLAKQHRN